MLIDGKDQVYMVSGDSTVFTYCVYLNSYLILTDRKELDQVYMLDGDNAVFVYSLYFNRYLMLIGG